MIKHHYWCSQAYAINILDGSILLNDGDIYTTSAAEYKNIFTEITVDNDHLWIYCVVFDV